jgi:hypothetical protein
MPVNTALVLGFLFSQLIACTLINTPDSGLYFRARIETLNEPTQRLYQNYPVICLELQN